MSNFKEAFDLTMKQEDARLSGVVTVDAGGRTRFGIAQKFHPDLPESFFDGPTEDALARSEEIYKHDYWDPMRLGEIANQNLANKLMDMGINMGTHQAGHLVQRALNALVSSSGGVLVEDGKIGDHTITAINAADPIQLHHILAEISKKFYPHIPSNNPPKPPHLNGWLKRAES